MEKLRQQLIIDEGVKYEVYLDHLQLKTVGIGHLCREDEPEFDQPVGTQIKKIDAQNCLKKISSQSLRTVKRSLKIGMTWMKKSNKSVPI